MRAPDVELPPGQSRCLPRGHCAQATVCARWLAPMTTGRALGDFTVDHLFQQGKCPKHLPVALYRKRPAGAPQPRVHDTPAGLA